MASFMYGIEYYKLKVSTSQDRCLAFDWHGVGLVPFALFFRLRFYSVQHINPTWRCDFNVIYFSVFLWFISLLFVLKPSQAVIMMRDFHFSYLKKMKTKNDEDFFCDIVQSTSSTCTYQPNYHSWRFKLDKQALMIISTHTTLYKVIMCTDHEDNVK